MEIGIGVTIRTVGKWSLTVDENSLVITDVQIFE